MPTNQIYYFILFLWLVGNLSLPAQSTWQGVVSDAETGEPLAYATLYDTLSQQGQVSNERGFFVWKLPQAAYLRVSRAGYRTGYFSLQEADPGQQLALALVPLSVDTVQIDALHPATMGMVGRISFLPAQVRDLPALGGEPDLVKALQMLPAASGGREGSSELNVRGGSRGQNLYLIDGMPLNHSGHLFNLFSVFNPDVLSQVDFYASGFPLRYGGRLSSVVDVAVREGSRERWQGRAELGVVSSKFLLEGPTGAHSSLLLGLRSSYLDLFNLGKRREVEEALREPAAVTNFGFTDFNGKYVYAPSATQRLSLSVYAGQDRLLDYRNSLRNIDRDQQQLYNLGASLRYQWTPRNNWFLEVGSYAVQTWSRLQQASIGLRRRIIEQPDSLRYLLPDIELDTLSLSDLSGQYRLLQAGGHFRADYHINNQQQLQLGMQVMGQGYRPGDLIQREEVLLPSPELRVDSSFEAPLRAVEAATYLGYRYRLDRRFSLEAGLRLSGFAQAQASYLNLLPRALLQWQPGDWGSLQLAYDRTVQYQHLLVRPDRLINHTTWVPSTDRILPQQARQVSLGVGGLRLGPSLQMAATVYYKWLWDLSFFPYIPGDDFWVENWQDRLLSQGQGRAYGSEWHLYLKRPQWEASLNYVLSWSERQFEGINRGEWFPDEFDRRHQLNVSGSYHFHPGWKLTAFWTLNSGHRINFPLARVPGGRYTYPFYTFDDFNARRLPLYHRLDLSIEQRVEVSSQRAWGWRLSLYNAYYRLNPYYLYLQQRPRVNPRTGQTEAVDVAVSVSLFPIIPALNIYYEF